MTIHYTIRNNKVYIKGVPHDKENCRRIFIDGKKAGIDLKEEANRLAEYYRRLGHKILIRKV